jgi:hypothetical protein
MNKSELNNKMFAILTDFKVAVIDFNSSVVMILEKISSFMTHVEHGHKIKFEFSGSRTPQRNGKVEITF